MGELKHSIHYRTTDNTAIKDTTMEELLSNINTNSELTTHLAEKMISYSDGVFSQVYGNVPDGYSWHGYSQTSLKA